MTAGDWPCATPLGQVSSPLTGEDPLLRVAASFQTLLLSKCPLGPWWPFLQDHCPRPAPLPGFGHDVVQGEQSCAQPLHLLQGASLQHAGLLEVLL